MDNTSSIVLVDDEVDFHQPFVKVFQKDTRSNYNLVLTQTGLQGLQAARKIIDRDQNSILVIDLILPDFPGENLIEILDKEKSHQSNFKAIIISAHKTLSQLQKLKERYSWIHDCFPKPIDTVYLKNVVDSLCGKTLKKFDYQQLDEETATFIRQQTGEIKLWMKQTAIGAIEAGSKILKIKEKLEYGQFQDWVQLELGCNHNTVLGLMRAAKVFGQEKERIARSGLGLSVVYLLSQGNIPSEMREEIVRQSESGTPISFKEAKKIQKKYKQKPENPLITQTPSTTSNQLTTKLETTKTNSRPIPTRANKHNHKQEIIQIIPQSTAKIPTRELAKNYWQLNQHLLFCGYPLEEEFIVKLPERVALTLAFPPFPDWSREALLPVTSNSTSVFQSEFTDVDPALLSSTVRQTIELYTEGGDDVIVSFLPDFDILQLIDFLGCRCLIAEPDLQRCQKILAKFEQWE